MSPSRSLVAINSLTYSRRSIHFDACDVLGSVALTQRGYMKSKQAF